MKNSHKLAFLLSLFGAAKAQADGPQLGAQVKKPALSVSRAELAGLFEDGVLQYEPKSHTVKIEKNASDEIKAAGYEKPLAKSLRETLGSDIKIKVVPAKDMVLSTQDRQGGV